MTLGKPVEEQRTPKPAGVNIVPPLAVLAAPSQMGSMDLILLAIGDDNKIYRWFGKEETWFLFNN